MAMAMARPQRQTPTMGGLLQLKLIKPLLRLVFLWIKMNPEAKVCPMEIIRVCPVATKVRMVLVTRKAIRKMKTPQTLIL